MKRIALSFAVALITVACATMSQTPQGLVSRAIQAQGGTDALAAIKTISVKGTMKQWEPEQSMTAGGEMRFANEATFDALYDIGTGASRTDWVKKFAYPAPRTFTFTEIVTPESGYVAGIDSNGRTKQSIDSNPPAHTMSGLRLAATHREMRRASTLLLLEMQKNPDRVTASPDIAVGGLSYPAVNYRVGDQTLTVAFDPATGLPARVRTLDYDNIWGDVNYDVIYSGWREVDGVNSREELAIKLALAITSPAGRPIQTTKDLPGFWAGSWRDVAKDMRGRYPKHPWPDDPTSAAPTLRTKRAS